MGWHRDATLGLKPGADAAPLAHRVSVLYVAVPEATGGELCLRNADRPPWRSERGVIDREVAPKQNRLAVFRGDAEHAGPTGHERDQGGRGLSQGPPRVPRARAI